MDPMVELFASKGPEVATEGLTPAMAALIGAGVAAFTSLVVALLQIPIQKYIAGRADRRDQQKLRAERLTSQLNDLYGPLLLLRRQNKYLYDKLRAGKPEDWHLLENIASVQGNPTERALAEAILKIDMEMEELIIQNAGLARGIGLPDSFTKFLGHSRALSIAWDRGGDVPTASEFEHFPVEFATEVEEGFNAIERELKRELGEVSNA